MMRSILDQNYIKNLNDRESCDAIIITPMFMWELFNNINNPTIEKKLIDKLRLVSDRIVITLKSISCEEIELDSGVILSFDRIINRQTTQSIRQLLHDNNSSISDIRDNLSPSLTPESFNYSFDDFAQNMPPKYQEGFKSFGCAKERESYREDFEAKNEKISEDLCDSSISICYEMLKHKGYSDERAILFLKEPSILYNRVFCCCAIFKYRSTRGAKKQITKEIIANDIKDADYLFLAHHAENLLSEDKVMTLIFLHLKKSHELLSKKKTGFNEEELNM